MKKTALNAYHKELGAKCVDFHGWELPIQYNSIIKEHEAVRNNCGIFDCSHMGQVFVEGPQAHEFINYVISNKFENMTDGKGVYSPLLYENGTFVDDLIVYALNPQKVLIIVNASNVEKDFEWLKKHQSNFDINISNQSDNYSLLAIQGKNASSYIHNVFPDIFENLESFCVKETTFNGSSCFIAKTGYTGEPGIEVIIQNDAATSLMKSFIDNGVSPCGLGARDSLRLEKGYSLYGNEIDDSTNALEAGLAWTVKFDKENFIGKDALEKIKISGNKRKLIGFKVLDRAIARHGDKFIDDSGKEIGIITSGIFSPSLKQPIGLGYIESSYSEDTVKIQLSKKVATAEFCKRSFL